MSLVINHNMMAANTARNLNTHYGNLATSTQHLSSGLRINGASDDAAGLAIRELMRADIAAYNQGIRNANDAISMIQVVDGALGVIDEKLIRMKELAEQAATGTYDSTQRLMIDSEFQAMASEIQRIATATDFNGIKMIDGKHNISLLDKGILEINGINLEESIINEVNYTDNNSILNVLGNRTWRVKESKHYVGEQIEDYIIKDNIIFKRKRNNINIETETTITEWVGQVAKWSFLGAPICDRKDVLITLSGDDTGYEMIRTNHPNDPMFYHDNIDDQNYEEFTESIIGFPNGIKQYNFSLTLENRPEPPGSITWDVFLPLSVNADIDTVRDNIIVEQIDIIKRGPEIYISNEKDLSIQMEKILELPITEVPRSDPVTIHFGPMNDSTEDYYNIEKRDCTLKGLGLEDIRIETQDKAQKALVTINDAIVKKDQARVYYGAMQNRLENTVSNLIIQSENLQASESRISDVDVATEMTNFVRNQILTQSAVAMLSQANSMPQMAMQLIGG